MFRLFLLCLVIFVSSLGPVFAGGDEGSVTKSTVYRQTSAAGPVLLDQPFHFIADIRNSVSSQTGTVLIPAAATWTPNPITVVDPALLFGAHYTFDQGYANLSDLNAAFPDGAYTFHVTRSYSSATTDFSQAVQFTSGAAMPNSAPKITNTTWSNGALMLHPASAKIFISAGGNGLGFSWGIVGGGGSAGGWGSAVPGTLDLTSFLSFNATYSAHIRFSSTDSAYNVTDPNAPANSYQLQSTYSAFRAVDNDFTIVTPVPPANLKIISAVYSSGGQTWDDTTLLTQKISGNAIIYRFFDLSELSGYSYTGQNGTLTVVYSNQAGKYQATTTFIQYQSNNYLIIPNPGDTALPLSYTEWASRNFSPANLSDLNVWSPAQDADHDGITNLMAFAFGLNPLAEFTTSLALPQTVRSSDGNFLGIQFRRNNLAQVSFAVKQSSDLVTWYPLNTVWSTQPAQDNSAVDIVTAYSATPITQVPKQFLRVQLIDNNPAPTPTPAAALTISSAKYGANNVYKDVTSILQANVVNGSSLNMQINNSTMGGDPAFGYVKHIDVQYIYQSTALAKTVSEGSTLKLP